jgi:pentatricopeptide repeat protein
MVSDRFDVSKLLPEDRLRGVKLRAARDYKNGNFHRAVAALSKLSWKELDEDSVIYYALALQALSDGEKAIRILHFASRRLNSVILYHYLADSYLRSGYVNEALSVFEEFLCRVTEPVNFARQLLVEYAQVIRMIEGVSNKFRTACERVVSREVFPPPQTDADWFFSGFAFHLLGNNELATQCYHNSSGFSSEYYDKIELTVKAGNYSS